VVGGGVSWRKSSKGEEGEEEEELWRGERKGEGGRTRRFRW
jgi:hypothetical protein